MAEGLKWRVNRAVRQSTLPPPSRLIMLVLADRADAKTAVVPDDHSPSVAELVNDSGLSEATVKRHLASLEASGWIVRERPTADQMARHVPGTYRLTIGSGGSERTPGSVADATDSGAQSDTPDSRAGGSERHPAGGSERTPEMGPGAQSEPTGGSERTPAGAQSEPPTYISDRNDRIDLTTAAADADGASDGGLFPVAESKPQSEPKRDPAERFEEFYKTYPRHKAPARAEAAWIKAVKAGAEPQVIIEAAERFAAWCKRTKQDINFVPYPATWLNDRSWRDEDDPQHGRQRPGQYSPYLEDPDDERPYAGDL